MVTSGDVLYVRVWYDRGYSHMPTTYSWSLCRNVIDNSQQAQEAYNTSVIIPC